MGFCHTPTPGLYAYSKISTKGQSAHNKSSCLKKEHCENQLWEITKRIIATNDQAMKYCLRQKSEKLGCDKFQSYQLAKFE